MPSLNLWLGGENIRIELQQVARGVTDLAKDASDEKRSWSHGRLVVGCAGSDIHREPNAPRY
jgi:hypothetical protein